MPRSDCYLKLSTKWQAERTRYPVVEEYLIEDAESAFFALNSAAETGKEAVDTMRDKGHQVGILSPNVLRPFPAKNIRKAMKNVKAAVIADRADSYGAHGGNMALEVKAALKDDPSNKTLCISRVFGLGGRDFYPDDAENLLIEAEQAAAGKSRSASRSIIMG